MKKILFTLGLFVISVMAKSQSGWQENSYYATKGGSDIICGNCYAVLTGYDYYGRPVYQWYQNCQRRDWHSWYGKVGGYFWACGNGNCAWSYQYEERTWWYFTWYNFTRLCQ